jgi:hypothetical protein
MDRLPMSIVPLDGLGMLASTPDVVIGRVPPR